MLRTDEWVKTVGLERLGKGHPVDFAGSGDAAHNRVVRLCRVDGLARVSNARERQSGGVDWPDMNQNRSPPPQDMLTRNPTVLEADDPDQGNLKRLPDQSDPGRYSVDLIGMDEVEEQIISGLVGANGAAVQCEGSVVRTPIDEMLF